MACAFDLIERGIVGLEVGPGGLGIAPRHRGIRIRSVPGRLGITVPLSPTAPPLPLYLPGGRAASVAPGRQRWFRMEVG